MHFSTVKPCRISICHRVPVLLFISCVEWVNHSFKLQNKRPIWSHQRFCYFINSGLGIFVALEAYTNHTIVVSVPHRCQRCNDTATLLRPGAGVVEDVCGK